MVITENTENVNKKIKIHLGTIWSALDIDHFEDGNDVR